MFFLHNNYFYYITIGLQAICAIHCMRKGNQGKWIWIIVFLPIVGCIAYIFTEIYTGRELQNLQSGIGSVLNPSGRISRLEENLRFADTFNNRVTLADAYLGAGQTDRAIEIYESSLTGAFTENEHVLMQLINAYFAKQQYEKVIPIAKKIYARPQFARSRAHMLYAMSLGYEGKGELAEQEFRKMKARFSDFESRYQYGLFLLGESREEEARKIFMEIVDEAPYLGSRERRFNRTWIMQAKEELKKARVKTPAS
jgi:hypothetical protein